MNHIPIRKVVALGLFTSFFLAGLASAQLPPRAFERFGGTKLRHGSRILCLAYSPDDKMLAAGGGDDPVRIWNPKTGELIKEINEPWVHAMTFSASGTTLLLGGAQRVIRLWNFELNKESGRLEGHKATVKAIAIAPDASIIASGGQDGAVYLWDLNNKRKVAELPGHSGEVNALIYFMQDDKAFLVSAGSDRSIIVWNLDNNQQKLKLDAGCGVYALELSADGKTLYSAGDDALIRRWDLSTGKQTGEFKGHDGIVASVRLRGSMLVSGGLDKTIRIWDAKTTQLKRTIVRTPGDCDALAVTEAGDFLASAGLGGAIRLVDARTGKEIHASPDLPAGLVGLSRSPDGTRLAGVSADGRIAVWSTGAGKLARQWDSKQTGELVLAFSPDNKTLAVAGATLGFWNADTGQEILQAPLPTGETIVSVAWSPDGKTLALARASGLIDLWDVEKKGRVDGLRYPDPLFAVAWSPDGKKLAAAGGAKIFVWSPSTKVLLKSFDVREGPPPPTPLVASLAFGPDSNTLAAGGWDALIRIYNLSAKNPTDIKERRQCEGHTSAIFSVAFSADGRSLVSGSFDRTARLWETFSGKQIASFKGHIGEVRGVAFARGDRSVYSASTDGTVLHWDLPGLSNDGKLPQLTLGFQELENAWHTLSTKETARGHEAMWRCIASAKQAVPALTKKIYLLDPERVKKLFKDLDSGHYPTRNAAMTELTNYGRWMEGRYDRAMNEPPSLEYKRRVDALKQKLASAKSPSLVQERLRVRRIMLMCEQAGTPEAVEALQNLAARAPEEELRQEAAAALRRMKK
ncbi:MAG: WD40 repeat domain-containing protein [Planctomycetes bacterium]|nr:WD40 repeat domain-containing protein [Planctomycetota bacterium]